mgnify:CR=1 FL=1|tara:strand:- start:3695 stop:4570 length:876 start_codon:yes stop_codon:yes gene_type:complete
MKGLYKKQGRENWINPTPDATAEWDNQIIDILEKIEERRIRLGRSLEDINYNKDYVNDSYVDTIFRILNTPNKKSLSGVNLFNHKKFRKEYLTYLYLGKFERDCSLIDIIISNSIYDIDKRYDKWWKIRLKPLFQTMDYSDLFLGLFGYIDNWTYFLSLDPDYDCVECEYRYHKCDIWKDIQCAFYELVDYWYNLHKIMDKYFKSLMTTKINFLDEKLITLGVTKFTDEWFDEDHWIEYLILSRIEWNMIKEKVKSIKSEINKQFNCENAEKKITNYIYTYRRLNIISYND